MESPILADVTASVTELQRDPMGMAASGSGNGVAVALETALQSLWKALGKQGLGASDMLNICVIKIINKLLNTYDNYTGKYKILLNFLTRLHLK